eukprot:snap_masked-scaffold_3-processed-gene-14.33-mRNA-1 protein AED:1.00 eAED:1.00 QI:0/0/0/0/1/1/3/0/92
MSLFHKIPSAEILREEAIREVERYAEDTDIAFSLDQVLSILVPSKSEYFKLPKTFFLIPIFQECFQEYCETESSFTRISLLTQVFMVQLLKN